MTRCAAKQKLTVRLVDSTGQTLQFKTTLKKAGEWNDVRIPFDRKMEHWGGSNDGKEHLPLKSISMSVPKTDAVSGKVEFVEPYVQ